MRNLKIMKGFKTKWQKLARGVRDVSKLTLESLGLPRRARTQPTTEASSSLADGNPLVDAIKGNPLPPPPASLWSHGDVPGTRSLKTCEDAGAAALLRQGIQAIQEPLPTQPLPELTIAHAGGSFEPGDVDRATVIDEADYVDHSEANAEGDSEAIAERKLAEMDDKLRQQSRLPFNGSPPGYYLPNDSLQSILAPDAIQEIIPCIARGLSADEANELVQVICGLGEEEKKPTKSFRKILAILILIGKAGHILEFVDADVSDAKLPLCKLPGDARPFQLCLAGSKLAIPLFALWKSRDIELFEDKQWETLAPFFSREVEGDERVRSYKLTTQHPLPFDIIKENECARTASGNPSSAETPGDSNPRALAHFMNGAHGHVWRVTIHRAHHSLTSYRGNEGNPSLAVKKLLASDREEFKNEVSILTRLNRDKHPHLVKLLLTMEIQGSPGKGIDFYLMFPLADSNLRQFWQHHFPHPPGMQATYGRWVARQLAGLTQALCKLHDLNEREVQDDAASSRTDPFYGIHGDIKPENLLWYKDWEGPSPPSPAPQGGRDPLGVLQLADFGVSRLHHTATRSVADLRRATKTYAAPEVEWGENSCSRSFDIWSLGCVFLEFICWLVLGGSGTENPVDTFQTERYLDFKNKSLAGTIQDTFYYGARGKDRTKFEVNPAVIELINTIQKAPACSAFVDDILHIISNKMLVVEPRKTSLKQRQHDVGMGKRRISCLDLHNWFKVEMRIPARLETDRDDDYFISRLLHNLNRLNSLHNLNRLNSLHNLNRLYNLHNLNNPKHSSPSK
ncbi:hypothetical protein NEMBOFW57_000344 [Staphylotrichum longicolle]|uniref:Protein kinase domain-containing protein n=1 Tax=Staphylotrichum longicolle TaxID=669026 RepID=A0AAD4HX05_9PEZI|nr:hypothetical protein NEMBOFW57_000344 [Staphylotrichum longicolle]